MEDSCSQSFREISSLENVTSDACGTHQQRDVMDSFEDMVLKRVNDDQFRIFVPAFSFVCCLLVIGLPGNILAIIVYTTQMKKGVARYFILTLAISDLITCSCIGPIELWIMKQFWTFDHHWLCKLFRFVAYTVNNISSLTLLAIAFERYRIICNPWKQKFTTSCSRFICVLLTLVAILTSVPMIFIYGTYSVPLFKYTSSQNDPSRNMSVTDNATLVVVGRTCMLDDKMAGSIFPFYINVIYIAATVIVFGILIYLYSCIARQLILQRLQNKHIQNKNSKKRSSKRLKHVTIMVFILTCVYELCYLPCLTIVCLRLVNPMLYKSLNESEKTAYQFFLKSYLINSAVNPCIYCYCNREFRLGAYRVLNKLRKACSNDQAKSVSGSFLSS